MSNEIKEVVPDSNSGKHIVEAYLKQREITQQQTTKDVLAGIYKPAYKVSDLGVPVSRDLHQTEK